MRRREAESDFDGVTFTPEQRKRLLKMLEAHEGTVRAWSTIGIWMKWIGAVLAALVAVKVLVGDLLKGAFR